MRWGTAAVVAAAAVGAGAVVLVVGRRASERMVHPPAAGQESGPVLVRGLAPGRVTFSRTPESLRPGRWAVEWEDGGHAVVEEVLEGDEQGVTRRLVSTDRGTLTPGTQVRFTPRVHLGDPTSALGLPFTDTAVDGELGALPAWRLDGKRGTWVILVHGTEADRQQTLPVLPVLHQLGLPVLSVTYRGDEGAPASPDGLSHFGETEWRDVESAVRLALDSGAGGVVLYGWSLGATMALQTAGRSAWAHAVRGLVLDSPVLDLPASARRDAARAGFTGAAAELGALAAEGRTGVDLADSSRLAERTDLNVPTLLLHSPADRIAPFRAAERLAAARSRTVSLQSFPGAEHAALWNSAPDRYTELLRRWFTPLL
ncbi:S9 family peptidase [Streptomyces sp. FH025]|uniref:alpha/beta hydrolase family protein n=1 Tax=Streptomyces sp. FH025 TaxID=2815937 RepID=UPI001A9E8950|nr:alpha/beta hydrolase [Streptomyces sp. FH025]MBO1414989.1 alpha/beta hydrolase [Streptomyces sp. FH025]